jgi:hypothetical protein
LNSRSPLDTVVLDSLPNVSALIEAGGQISLGAVPPIDCAAVANDEHSCYAMLERRPKETLDQLMKRLDEAIASAWKTDVMVDEINPPAAPSKPRLRRRS